MAGRRTNLALLAGLAAAFVTGALAFATGSGWARWPVIAHGVAGVAVLALAPWKSVIVRRGMARRRSGRHASIVLAALVVVAIVGGIGHSTGALTSIGPLSAMQVHVGAAIAALPLAAWHVAVRPARVARTDLSRRNALRAAGVLGAAGAAYAVVGAGARVAGLPGATRRFTGSYERGSFDPEQMPVTQWLNDRVPLVDAGAWRLRVAAGGDELRLTLDDLAVYDDEVEAVLDCTGGWFATQRWSGVRLDRLVGTAAGRSVRVRSLTGYARSFPMADAAGLLLATRAAGEPLSAGHGAPARLVAPGRRGFWWVKWVESIEVTDAPWWLQPPFPLT